MSIDVKPAGYYGENRADLVAMLPRPIGRALDIGCGEGAVGRELLAQGATSVHGVEIFPEAAAVAQEAYAGVAVAPVEVALTEDELPREFDTILCYDVLEHLADPALILGLLRERAAPGAHLHVSVPNARHFGLMKDLVVRGTFGYTDYGHRDRTHLRWFTRRDIEAVVQDAGWTIEKSSNNPFRGRDEPFNKATRGKLREFIAIQWNVLAVAR
jgi:2-polyprenyl-3-methyl-5-hydroxy-6-metoxy-1,4-benzoquinol methylase